jgi:hypothetical protein
MIGVLEELQYCIEKKGYSPNLQNTAGDTVLHVAVEFRQIEAVKLICKYRNVDYEVHGKAGLTPLMLALGKGKPAMAIALVQGGANPNTHDNNYIYPLHKAAEAGEMDLVRALVDRGADVNVRTRDTEDTPLNLAIQKGRRGVAEYLVSKGARIDIAGKEGKTGAMLAKEAGPQMLKVVDPQQAANENMRQPPMEIWELATPTTVAKISTIPALQRKITEIFNFETKERMTVTRNLKTGAESVGDTEPFASLAQEAVDIAAKQMKIMGGHLPGERPPPTLAESPFGKFKV